MQLKAQVAQPVEADSSTAYDDQTHSQSHERDADNDSNWKPHTYRCIVALNSNLDTYESQAKTISRQAVVRGTTNPAPVRLFAPLSVCRIFVDPLCFGVVARIVVNERLAP